MHFLQLYKSSKVCPIRKANDPAIIIYYRLISIISVFAKVFEMYSYGQLLPYVNMYIGNAQYGFFCRRSTVTNIIYYMEYINNNINNGKHVNVIQMNFLKAFHKVDTVILMYRLRDLGLSFYLLNLSILYLINRSNYVIELQTRSNSPIHELHTRNTE